MLSLALFALALPFSACSQSYTATYLPSNAPVKSEQGQTGTNQCGTGFNQTSQCQNVYINSIDDWCIFAPPDPGPESVIGNTERIEVSWCIKPGFGTRLIPDGAITGAHFVQTPDYVQVTGVGDLTKINIPNLDEGGELDPHGADGNGNPIGGLVFSSAFTGQLEQLHEWTNFVSYNEFCIRGCKDGPNAPALCQHIYDVMGCFWNMPGNYDAGTFERCLGDTGEPMGVYGTSTFHQGEPFTPSAHPAPASSQCTTVSSIGNLAASTTAAPSSGSSITPTSVSAPPSSSASGSVVSSPSAAPSSSQTGASVTPAPITISTGTISQSSSAPLSTMSGLTSSASGAPGSDVPTRAGSSTSSSGTSSQTGTSGATALTLRFGWEGMVVALGIVSGALFVL